MAFAGSHVNNVGIYEYSGLDQTSPLDQSAANTGTSTTPNGGSLTTTLDNELYFAVGVDYYGNNSTLTAGSGYTLENHNDNSESSERFYSEDRISSHGSYQSNFTIAAGSAWAVIGGSFKPAGSITPTPTPTSALTFTPTPTSALSPTPTPTGGASQLLLNPGFESGNQDWQATSGVIFQDTSNSAHSGGWYAWLDGYGTTHTDTLAQTITVPSNATAASLSFYLKVDSAETTPAVYDTLNVQIKNTSGSVLATLATYSNLDKSSSYSQKSFDLLASKGQTIQIYFTGTEDEVWQTSFLIDDAAVSVIHP